MTEKDQEEEDRKAFEELFNSNDPKLRADVKAALKSKHWIDDPDPFLLELSLKYGDDSFYDRERKVSDETIEKIRSAIKECVSELKQEPASARSIVIGNILHATIPFHDRYYYNLPSLSEWQIDHQPDPKTFTDLLEQGEDPRFIALMMINIYGSRQDFAGLSMMVGYGILNWDNTRSLDYQERQAHKPENKNLSNDMRIEPSGLVAIEPYVDLDRDFHYDIYGSTVAEVTSFSIHFVPNKNVQSRYLQRHVEHAINRFIDEGEITFQPPTSYKKPHNAYKRPKGIDKRYHGESYDYWGNFISLWKTKNPTLVREHWGLFHVTDEDTKEVFDSGEVSGGYINQWLLSDDFPEDLPQKLIDDIKEAAEEIQRFRHTTVNDEGHVVLNNTLILDDVLQLYEFCDGFLTPSVQIAQALEAARYAEECGPLQSPGGLGDDFSKDHLRLTDQLGNFDDVDPEHIVDRALQDIMAFYGRGGDAQMAFLQAASLAHGTLTGILPDGTGRFPILRQIADGTRGEKSSELSVIAQGNMSERTTQLLKRAVTLFGNPDSDLPLKEQFADAAESMSELLRYQQKVEDICKHYLWDMKYNTYRHKGRSMLDEIIGTPEALAELLAEERNHALHCLSRQKPYEPQYEPLAVINALERREEDNLFWVREDGEKKKKDDKRNSANEFTEESDMPDNLDVVEGYMWRCCKESIFRKPTILEEDPDFLPAVRANIDLHGGVVPLQLPRNFTDTSYVTRPKGAPFPRPNTDLPDELADLLPKRPSGREERVQLPDPSVVWGRAGKPSP